MDEELIDLAAYENADDAHFEVLTKYAQELFKVHKRSKYPQTYRAMLAFVVKLNSLKNAMYDMVRTNNPYAFSALFRCFLDHYLKFTYVFCRFLVEERDDVGNDYWDACGAQELLDYLSAIRTAQAIVGVEAEAELSDMFSRIYPNARDTKDLASTSAKFKYRAIIRYMAKEAPEGVSEQVPFLAAIIPRFATLSAFVHGGPYTDNEMGMYATPKAIKDCKQELGVVLAMSMSSLLFTGVAISREFETYRAMADDVRPVLRAWLDDPE